MKIVIDTEFLRPSTLAAVIYDLDDVEYPNDEDGRECMRVTLDARNTCLEELVTSEGAVSAAKMIAAAV